MRPRVLIALAGTFLALHAAPAAAQMSVAVKVFEDYAADGQIDPCKHSSEELRTVQRNIPPDVEQYAPDYPAAVAGALEARARGECDGTTPQPPAPTGAGGAGTPTPTPTPVPTAVPKKTIVEAPPEPERATAAATPAAAAGPDAAVQRAATATASNAPPAALILLALLAALMLGATLFAFAARRLGWTEDRLASPWHAWREAGWRAEGLWQDFRDWARLGR